MSGRQLGYNVMFVVLLVDASKPEYGIISQFFAVICFLAASELLGWFYGRFIK